MSLDEGLLQMLLSNKNYYSNVESAEFMFVLGTTTEV
jgi:hypothetical protein